MKSSTIMFVPVIFDQLHWSSSAVDCYSWPLNFDADFWCWPLLKIHDQNKCLWPLFYCGVTCAKGVETRIKVSMNSPLKINVVDRKLQVWKWACCDQKLVLNYDPDLSLKVVGLQICEKNHYFPLIWEYGFECCYKFLARHRHDEIAHLKFKKKYGKKNVGLSSNIVPQKRRKKTSDKFYIK